MYLRRTMYTTYLQKYLVNTGGIPNSTGKVRALGVALTDTRPSTEGKPQHGTRRLHTTPQLLRGVVGALRDDRR